VGQQEVFMGERTPGYSTMGGAVEEVGVKGKRGGSAAAQGNTFFKKALEERV